MELSKLKILSKEDPERAHILADDALLDYIGDDAITTAFNSIKMWYA